MFVWENVYAYDRDFRLHLSVHPDRNWGIILQQAWMMRMVERLNRQANVSGTNGVGNVTQGFQQSKKLCYKYNRGKCTYGFNCKFDHRCRICSKFGHGAHICRKGNDQNKDREKDRSKRRKFKEN